MKSNTAGYEPAGRHAETAPIERDFFIDNLLVRTHYTIVMIRWPGLAPWEFACPYIYTSVAAANRYRGTALIRNMPP